LAATPGIIEIELAMDKIINFQLLKHPMNWIIVILMVLIAGIAFHFFMQYQVGSNPAKAA
jgi:hypothetical protein